MKNENEVQIFGERRMRSTANWSAWLLVCGLHASSSRNVWHGLATAEDSMRELWLLVPSRYTEQADPLEVSLF